MARINLASIEIAESLPTFEPMIKMAQINNSISKYMKPRKDSLSERSFDSICATKRKAERRAMRRDELNDVFEEEFTVQEEELAKLFNDEENEG